MATDIEKIKAQADAIEQGYDVQFDSDEEARATAIILNIRQASKIAQHPGSVVQNKDSFFEGLKPGIMDYAPVLKGFDFTTPMSDPSSAWASKSTSMSLEEKKAFGDKLALLPDDERWRLVQDLVKQNWQRDVEKNQQERRKAKALDPNGYNLGQLASGVGVGLATGAAAGPSVAGQGFAGMASGGIMDPTPRGVVTGGLMGAGIAGAIKGVSAGRGTASDIINGGVAPNESGGKFGDAALAKWLKMTPQEIATARANGDLDDILDVVRANTPASADAQAGYNNIQVPAIQRGAQGTQAIPNIGHQEVNLPVEESTPLQPNTGRSWLKPSGRSREVDLSMPAKSLNEPTGGVDADLSSFHGEPTLYDRTSSQELQSMEPTHPGADQALSPAASRSAARGLGQGQSTIPATMQTNVPPLSPPERQASEFLARRAGVSSDPSSFVQSPKAGIIDTITRKGSAIGALNIPKITAKMQSMLSGQIPNGPAGAALGGVSGASNAKLNALISAVSASQTPDVDDYIAQEMDPAYNALRAKAQELLEKDKENGR